MEENILEPTIPIKTILEHLSKFRPNIYRQLNILN